MHLISRLLRSVLKLAGLAAVIGYLFSRKHLDSGGDHSPPPPKGVKWLPCGQGSNERTSKTIGRGGGTLDLRGHVLDVPQDAVDRDTRFTLHELPTPNVTVLVTAAGPLRGTVDVTLSYARCGGPAPGKRLVVWRFRGEDGWQDLGGETNPQARAITVRNTRISRFAIAEH